MSEEPPKADEELRLDAAERAAEAFRPGEEPTGDMAPGEREGRIFEIGDRNAIDFSEQVALDVRYIESHSLRRDLLILVKTVPAVLLGKGM